MAYTPTNWTNFPSTATPVNASNLNKIENELVALDTGKADESTVTTALEGKVDKVEGKGLSTEDFTTAEKTKLAGISAEANKVEITPVVTEGTTLATISIDGVDTDIKGSDIEVDSAMSPTSENPVQNKVITNAFVEMSKQKADKNGEITSAKASYSLLCDTPVNDSAPYTYRQFPATNAKLEKLKKLIGASVVWNQLAKADKPTTTVFGVTYTNNSDGSWTLTGTPNRDNLFYNLTTPQYGDLTIKPNHVYYMSSKSNKDKVGFSVQSENASGFQTAYIYINDMIYKAPNFTVIETTRTWARLQISNLANVDIGTVNVTPQIFDLTAMFGSTIADYVNTLETAQAGSGIAWLKSYGFFTEDYYAYSENTIQSVSVSKHITKDSESQTLTETALDHTTLRGLFKLDANNNLYADGDIYNADGSGSVKYEEVDMGDLNWQYNNNVFNVTISDKSLTYKMLSSAYITVEKTRGELQDGELGIYSSGDLRQIAIRDNRYTDSTIFKGHVTGEKLIYELSTPTTASLTPFNPLSVIEQGGTEEFVDYGVQQGTRDVAIPCGTDTDFYQGLSLPALPTSGGKVELTYDPTNGVFSWE